MFAQIQMTLVKAGIGIDHPQLVPIQEQIQAFARLWADEAVGAATLSVTEADIAVAVRKWAKELQAAGDMVNGGRLLQVAGVLLDVGQRCADQRSRALINLPPEADALPPHLEKRIRDVMEVAFSARREREAMVRLVRALVRDVAGQPRNDASRVPVRDADLTSWVRAYAHRLRMATPFMSAADADMLAGKVTNAIVEGNDIHGDALMQLAEERGFRDHVTLCAYVRRLDGADKPVMVQQQAQQPQGPMDDAKANLERAKAQLAQARAHAATPTIAFERAARIVGWVPDVWSQDGVRCEGFRWSSEQYGTILSRAASWEALCAEKGIKPVAESDVQPVQQQQAKDGAVSRVHPAEQVARAEGWTAVRLTFTDPAGIDKIPGYIRYVEGEPVTGFARFTDNVMSAFRQVADWVELCRVECIRYVLPGENTASGRDPFEKAATEQNWAKMWTLPDGWQQFGRFEDGTAVEAFAARDWKHLCEQRRIFVVDWSAVTDNRKGVMPNDSAEGEDVTRPGQDGGTGRAGEDIAPQVTAEPAAWAYEVRDDRDWIRVCGMARPDASPRIRDIRPLYAAPAASRQTPSEDIAGDALTLRSFIERTGVTPSMMEASRDHWKERAEAAERSLQAAKPDLADWVEAAPAAPVASFYETAARAAGWDRIPNAGLVKFKNRNSGGTSGRNSWCALCEEKRISLDAWAPPARAPGPSPAEPVPQYAGASAAPMRTTTMLAPNGLHRPTWEAAMTAAGDALLSRDGPIDPAKAVTLLPAFPDA